MVACEVLEELVVEVVAVGQDDDRGVLHGRVLDELARVERHGQAFAGALRVPDDADAPVAGLAGPAGLGTVHQVDAAHVAELRRLRAGRAGAQGLLDRRVDRVVLMVAGHLLDQHAVAGVLEDDEGADEIEEAAPVEDALDDDLELAEPVVGQCRAVDGAPGHEPFAVGGEGADAGMDAVGDDQRLVEGEEGGDLLFVGLKLVEGGPDGGVLGGRVLQFHDRQRQAVDEEHDIGAALVAVFDDGELVDRQPVVVVRVVEIEDAHQVAAQRAVGAEVFHGHALDQHAVDGMVVGGQGGAVGAGQLAVGFVERGGGHARVETGERVAQAAGQHDLGVVVTFGGRFAGRDGRAELHRVAQVRQPGEGGFFDDGFGEGGHGLP